MTGGKGIYRAPTNSTGKFTWSGVIKYKTPEGIFQNYEFKQDYQVTAPSISVSATGMNVFYRGIKNPLEFGVGGLPKENIRPVMTNGRIEKDGNNFFVLPDELDESGRNTTITLYATIGGTERKMGTTTWRVKRVPDPVATIASLSGGDIARARLLAEEGVFAVLEDFDFDFKYKVTEFELQTTEGGYTTIRKSTSNRFTPEQKNLIKNAAPQSIVYIGNIKAVGDDGSTRDLDPISFKVR
jgi:gliding motility-associated protein GldM